MSDLDLTAFYGQFRDETAENVRRLTDGLLVLERQPGDRATLDGIFRAVHTIKGSARMLGMGQAGRLAHSMESVLGEMRSGKLSMTRELNDILLAGGDLLLTMANAIAEGRTVEVDVDGLIGRLTAAEQGAGGASPAQQDAPPAPRQPAAPAPAPAPAPPPAKAPTLAPAAPIAPAAVVPATSRGNVQTPTPPPAPSGPPRPTVRVRVDRLDQLLNTTGELVVGRQVDREHHEVLEELGHLLDEQSRALRALDTETRLIKDTPSGVAIGALVNQLRNLGQSMEQRLRSTVEQWTNHASRMAMLVDDLEAEVMATRLQPIAGLFAPIPRSVRELARALGRDVNLVVEGETTEADRKIIEALGEALLHMVRNALDHGLEPPDERARAGKPAQGTLRLAAESYGGQVRITVADDGRGMDPRKIRESAVRKNLLQTEDAGLLTDEESLELIFLPGFSTSEIITDISGRGVGLDAVWSVVTELSGTIEIDSKPGQGTAITIVLPLTLLTARVLIVKNEGEFYALPSSACQGGIRVDPTRLNTIEGRPVIEIEGRTIPVATLSELLGTERHVRGRRAHAVLIGPSTRPTALLVDDLLDEREVVIKALGPLFAGQRLCSGGIIQGDGKVVMLLNPAALLEQAREGRHRWASRTEQKPRAAKLLVSEDSFMTRELIRSILQSAGYLVDTAVDGRDALDKLRAGSYDLLVSDVEMPHLTGYELTSRLREELGLTIPVILCTSLARPEDKRRGLMAGAQAYIVKSEFHQDNLLETVRQLLGR